MLCIFTYRFQFCLFSENNDPIQTYAKQGKCPGTLKSKQRGFLYITFLISGVLWSQRKQLLFSLTSMKSDPDYSQKQNSCWFKQQQNFIHPLVFQVTRSFFCIFTWNINEHCNLDFQSKPWLTENTLAPTGDLKS